MLQNFYDDIYTFISEDQRNDIRYLSYSVSGFSLFGSLLILLIYLINKDLRNFSFSLILNLTISVALQDISKLLSIGLTYFNGRIREDVLCVIEAYCLNYSQLSALFWSSIISWSLYSTVILVRKKITTDQDRFYLVGFGTPISISLIPLISDDYGVYEMGCWITAMRRSLRGTIIRNICYYIPLLLGIIVNFYLINKVRVYVNRALPDDPSAVFLNRLQWYPYLLLLILVTFLVKVIALFITHNNIALFVVLICTTLCQNSLGVFNFIIFGYTKSVKEAIFNKVKEVIGVNSNSQQGSSGQMPESEKEEGQRNSNSNSSSIASEKMFVYEEESKANYYHKI